MANNIQNENPTPKKTRGRPLAFDESQVLEKALHVFWARGYEGTSMSDLVDLLGINKPSLYAKFGNKEELFDKAVELYLTKKSVFVSEALNAETASQVIEKFLIGAAKFLTDPSHPSGSMIVQGALSCGENTSAIHQKLIVKRAFLEAQFKERFDTAKTKGELNPNTDTISLAKYLTTLYQGMSVQATSGATQSELVDVVKLALENFSASH
jgi:AcrR family transcriptional regulator